MKTFFDNIKSFTKRVINKDNKNNTRIKKYLPLFAAFIILFVIINNNHETKKINAINNIAQLNTINNKTVPPKELFIESWSLIKTNYYNENLNKQNWNRWKKRYINKIKTEQDAYVAINSMLVSLNDSYSKFMSQEEFQEQNNAINSKLYGIGINVASISGKIYVANVLENAPAYQAGILSGDIILRIDNIDISGKSIYQIAQLIRGDINTTLNLELLRGNRKINKTLRRAEIEIKTIDSRKINDIAYIRISSFIGLETPKEFIVALNKYKDSKALIIDLRGNSGGLFQNAIVISNLFIKKGTIVEVIARQGKKNTYNAQEQDCIYNKPIVVLVDEKSASASEILASCLKDNNRAVIVGTQTYGKGLVQKIFPLPSKTGLNLTIAHYLTPNKKDINKEGITPDYIVTPQYSDYTNGIDTQLIFAQNLLEKQLLSNSTNKESAY